MSRFFGVIPAAGRSVRMGRPKLLLPWRGRTVIEQVIAAWQASRVAHLVVVVHPADADLADLLRRASVDVVLPPLAPPDMKASICYGLARLAATQAPTDADAWLTAPADLPGLTAAAIDAVIAARDPLQPSIVTPRIELSTGVVRRGHPVLFPWRMAAEVADLPAEQGLNVLVERGPVRQTRLDQPQLVEDLDTPEDYARAIRGAEAFDGPPG